jgi:hypothetical protein
MASDPALGKVHRRLRRGPAVRTGDLTLTPVVLEELGAGVTAGTCWLLAAKRPLAVIVAGPAGRRLIRLERLDGAYQEQ